MSTHPQARRAAPTTSSAFRDANTSNTQPVVVDQQATPPDGAIPRKPPAMARTLVDEVKLMIDQYAEVLDYGLTKHNGRVKPDEIQRLFTTAYIQKRQYSSVA